MRKLTFRMNLSPDGHIAAPGDDLGSSVPSDEPFGWWSHRVGATGPALYGRKLWETMSSHWPTADQQPGATPAQIEFTRWPAGELDLRRCGARLLVGGRPVGAHRLPQFAPVQRRARRPYPVGPPPERLVARHARAEVVAGRGDVAVRAQVHAEGQFPHASAFRGSVVGVQANTARTIHRSDHTEGRVDHRAPADGAHREGN